MIQITDAPLRNILRVGEIGTSGGVLVIGFQALVLGLSVPDHTGIKRLRRQHGKDHGEGEKDARGTGIDGGQCLELHQSG